jgi:hypothetical protein
MFVAFTLEKQNNRIIAAGTSAHTYTHQQKGYRTEHLLEFLHAHYKLQPATFIWYAAEKDVETLLQDLPPKEKDKAFPSRQMDEDKRAIRKYIEQCRAELKASPKRTATLTKRIEISKRKLYKLEYCFYKDFRLKVIQGKSLLISKGNKSITIYDIFSFFKKPLPEVARSFLGTCPPFIDRTGNIPLPLWANKAVKEAHNEVLYSYIQDETRTIVQLAKHVQRHFEKAGINLKRWYGISAAANHCLNKWRVNLQFTKQTEENTPRELWQAFRQAHYGGRIETLKLGTVNNGYLYDINSAYPFAACLLGQARGHWQFTREYDAEQPFALWRLHYKLPSHSYLGILPHRLFTNATVYRQAGRGWYYAPEVAELTHQHPDCFIVEYGYVMPFKPVHFAEQVERLYNYRLELKAKKNPSESLFKGLLHAICGKFGQTIGHPRFYCESWAGWITSKVRAMLSEACVGRETDVVCFAQDALHTLKPLDVNVDDSLGAWKVDKFDKGVYLQSGVYEHAAQGKKRTRGLEAVDFNAALFSLNQGLNVKASRQYFVGWRMSQSLTEARKEIRQLHISKDRRKEMLESVSGNYLERVSEVVTLDPLAVVNREFEKRKIDWGREYLDSRMLTYNDGRESKAKQNHDNMRRRNMMLDVITARRF